jgi:hypothetical protein
MCSRGYAEARCLDEDILIRCHRVLGDDHPDALTSAGNLAPTCVCWATTGSPTYWRRRRESGEDGRR